MATAFTFAQANVDKTYSIVDPTKKPGRGILTIHTRVIDADKMETYTGSTLAVSDIIQLFDVPRGYTVVQAGIGTTTVAAAAAKASIGMNGGTAWFMNTLDVDDISLPASTAGSQKGPQHNDSAADTVDLLEASAAQDLSACVFMAFMILLHTGERTRHVYPT
jgi:hypothetical protein